MVTVPASFTLAQREAMQVATTWAGIRVRLPACLSLCCAKCCTEGDHWPGLSSASGYHLHQPRTDTCIVRRVHALHFQPPPQLVCAMWLQVLRLIDEPTSAALAVYGLDRPHMPLTSAKSSAQLAGMGADQQQAAPQTDSVRECVPSCSTGAHEALEHARSDAHSRASHCRAQSG